MMMRPRDKRIGIALGILFFVAGGYGLWWMSLPAIIPCTGDQAQNFQCHKTLYEAMVKREGVMAAVANLKDGYAKSPYIVSQCHQLSHLIGNASYEKYASISRAFKDGDSFCWSGYYHGVVERAVGIQGTEYVQKHLNDFCADIPGKDTYSFEYYNCVHGLGHGLMSMTKNELFDSLRLCDVLSGGWEKQSCYGGAFMENVMADYRNHKTNYLKDDDLLYPCTGVKEAYKYQCYLMQTSYVLKKNGYDFKDVFERCAAVPSPYDETCAQSIGRDASGGTISNAKETKARCDLAPTPSLFHNCMLGAVKDFVSYFHSDVEAKEFCALFDEKEKAPCEETVRSYYSTFAKP